MSLKGILYTLAVGVTLVIAMLFFYLNQDEWTIHYYYGSITLPSFLIIALAIFIGMILMGLLSLVNWLKSTYRLRHYIKMNERLKNELDKIKSEVRSESVHRSSSATEEGKLEINKVNNQ